MRKKKVVILYSSKDTTPEGPVSEKSANNVEKAIRDISGYIACRVPFSKSYIKNIQDHKPDLVFNCMHGVYGEDGSVSGALDSVQLPYTHSGVLPSALCFNKKLFYDLWSEKVSMPQQIEVTQQSVQNNALDISYPVLIKPCSQGSSIGVELVENYQDLQNYHFKYGRLALVQEYIEGKEIHIALLNGKALGGLEVRPLRRKFYDYYSKYTTGATQYILPPDISQERLKKCMDISEHMAQKIGCRCVVRVEFILNKDDQIVLLEFNTNPGMTDLSICPMIAKHYCNMTFVDLVKVMIDTATCSSI